jgi:ABC-type sugar transport system substrate-binding protein
MPMRRRRRLCIVKTTGDKAGEIIKVGFDLSPQIVATVDRGWVQLAADQQPF